MIDGGVCHPLKKTNFVMLVMFFFDFTITIKCRYNI